MLWILDLLHEAGVQPWVDGGWGVDALVGHQRRTYSDLDLVLDTSELSASRRALERVGFEMLRDWLPAAIAYRQPDGREVDLHPVESTADGGGDQDLTPDPPFHYGAPSEGVIAGRRVLCVDGETQLRAHCGYVPSSKDYADVHALATHLSVDPPSPYH